MKIVITGSIGHISKPLTQDLVHAGHSVTVVSSKSDKQKDITAIGAKAAIGTIEDVEFLTNTFKGADAVYTMLPPPNFANPDLDLMGGSIKLMNNYATAIQRSGVKRVVHLSSIGAHLSEGTGLILIHRQAEVILAKVPNINITFMRPVGFYYNLFSFIGEIKATGAMTSNYGAEDMIPWVSPRDIASAIANEIVTPATGEKIRYVASEELSCTNVARILGEAIGIPDLKWSLISDEQIQGKFEKFGMPKSVAKGLVEMQANMHRGPFYEDYYKHRPEFGETKLKDFAKEFSAVYRQG